MGDYDVDDLPKRREPEPDDGSDVGGQTEEQTPSELPAPIEMPDEWAAEIQDAQLEEPTPDTGEETQGPVEPEPDTGQDDANAGDFPEPPPIEQTNDEQLATAPQQDTQEDVYELSGEADNETLVTPEVAQEQELEPSPAEPVAEAPEPEPEIDQGTPGADDPEPPRFAESQDGEQDPGHAADAQGGWGAFAGDDSTAEPEADLGGQPVPDDPDPKRYQSGQDDSGTIEIIADLLQRVAHLEEYF